MEPDPRSPVFDTLLALNPWARPFWKERLGLLDQGRWNVSYLNQSGNAVTREVLLPFFRARSDATLARLAAGRVPDWNRSIYDVVAPLFADRTFVGAQIGTPMIPTSDGGALVNNSEEVEGYTIGQFKADVLLLAQPGLYEVRLSETLDLSSLSFVIGPHIYVSEFEGVIAHETRFGPLSAFVSCRFHRFDAAGAEFFGTIDFVPSRFAGDANFEGVSFHGGANFSGVSFDAAADFSGAKFGDWTAFSGTYFAQKAQFDNVTFEGVTEFDSAIFRASADFTGATSARPIATAGIEGSDVAAMIRSLN